MITVTLTIKPHNHITISILRKDLLWSYAVLHNLKQNKCRAYFIYTIIIMLLIKASVTFKTNLNI